MSVMAMLAEVLGWLGAGMLLVAYALVSYGYARSSGVTYQSLNFTGSIFLLINTAWHGAWPSSALNIIWAVIAIGVLIRAPSAFRRTRTPQSGR